MPYRPLFFFLFLIFGCLKTHSFEIQRYDNEIDPFNPNYKLLNEGLFRAANEIREQYNLQHFQKNDLLQKTAESHAYQMITTNFYGHKNPNNSKFKSLTDRVKYTAGGKFYFNYLAENIANYDILATESMFCLKRLPNGNYFYFNCNSKKRIPILTYKALAKLVIDGWMKSPSHRENLLDPNYKYLGTAAQLSENPYKSQNPPFARLVQNFGG
jgi:uncharacterized protein YkwD